jgi:DNA-binding SARP family transcriptional activator
MTRLTIQLFGPFQVFLNGSPVQGFKTDKDRMLLAYLAVETARPTRREALAELLWPDRPQGAALANLRHTLAILRKALEDHCKEPPCLLVSRQTIHLNPDADIRSDAARFLTLMKQGLSFKLQTASLEAAVRYYTGEFLEGAAMTGCSDFEGWVLSQRQIFHQQAVSALRRLADHYEEQHEIERALPFCNRLAALEPWDESAHRQLMRLLAKNRQREAALAHYQTLERTLGMDLGTTPGLETATLYEQIRDQTLAFPPAKATSHQAQAARLPAFLKDESRDQEDEPVFVARQREMDLLEGGLSRAMAKESQLIFLSGEAGQGKTALLRAFAGQAQAAQPDLITALGSGDAFTGAGDPYHPFRQILRWLVGDFEIWWRSGAISHEHALRLSQVMPLTIKCLMAVAPDLVDTFVSGPSLLKLVQAYQHDSPELLDEVQQFLELRNTSRKNTRLQQADLFEQYSLLLEALSLERPILLLLDDMQWADPGSVGLLFKLSRRLRDSRVMIAAAYRPGEVRLGQDGQPHSLLGLIQELQQDGRSQLVDLDQADNQAFVSAILDSRPNRLDPQFREALYHVSGGHALFCIELLRDMVDRGDLFEDDQQLWAAAPDLDWEKLPPRLEAALARRTARLPDEAIEVLKAASVGGEEFEAEVIAGMLGKNQGSIIRQLSGVLGQKHKLVQPVGVEKHDGTALSVYRFRHILFQKYIYQHLDPIEKTLFHQEIGKLLEEWYAGREDDIAPRLAWHFREADNPWKAVHYFHRSGERALRMYADAEAIQHFEAGLALLECQPQDQKRNEQELAIQLAVAGPLRGTKGYGAPEVGRVSDRAYELALTMESSPQLFWVLFGLGGYFGAAENLRRGRQLCSQAAKAAGEIEDRVLVRLAHAGMGVMETAMGWLDEAKGHFEAFSEMYTPEIHRHLVFQSFQDFGVTSLTWLATITWLQGYPDRALDYSQRAIGLARQLGHPLSLAFALDLAGMQFHALRGEMEACQRAVEEVDCYARKQGLHVFVLDAQFFQGWLQTHEGDWEEGLGLMRQALAAIQAAGMLQSQPVLLCIYAEACFRGGLHELGLQTITAALDLVAQIDGGMPLAELLRLEGEMLQAQGAPLSQVESRFVKAIETAQQQKARLWELRAVMSLSRLRQRQGQPAQARALLAEVYAEFTEGFNTPDLIEARALLEALEG